MKYTDTTKGWIIVANDGRIYTYSFARTRAGAIAKWMSLWDPDRCSWRKFKKEGYKCVKAQQITDITKD